MRKFIFAIIILCLSVWLGLKMLQDPGLAFFAYRDWTVETPLWFAVLVMLAAMWLVSVAVRLLARIDASFYQWKNWLNLRRRNKADSKTNRGLLELIEGQWRKAENDLLAGIDQSEAPIINFLAAAKAAHERGAYEKRDLYLRQARGLTPKAEVAVALTRAQLQFEQGQYEQALLTLNHLRSLAPSHPVMLKQLEKIYVHLADWENLLKLIPSLRKARVYTPELLNKLEQHTWQELLNTAATKSFSLINYQAVWDTMPRSLQKNPNLIFCYAKNLLVHPETVIKVEELINKTLKQQWDKNLVKLYSQLHTADARKQLQHAEKWLKQYPHQAVLFLTLGKLSKRCQLWGKARSYFEESLKFEASPEAYFEYAKLLEQLGETTLSMKNYQQGLSLVF